MNENVTELGRQFLEVLDNALLQRQELERLEHLAGYGRIAAARESTEEAINALGVFLVELESRAGKIEGPL